MNEKLNWDEFFIVLVALYSSRGSCNRLMTACILVKNKRIVGAGYNGAVSRLKNCDEAGHKIIDGHCERTLHGEENSLHNAIRNVRGATAYIIGTPCIRCVRSLLQRGIARIVYVGSYENSRGKEYIEELCQDKTKVGEPVVLEQWSKDPSKILKLFQKAMRRLQGPGGIFAKLNPISVTCVTDPLRE